MSFSRSGHATGCKCSVCWAHNFADALQLMPYTNAERTLYTDYLTFYDYSKQFAIENAHTHRVGSEN